MSPGKRVDVLDGWRSLAVLTMCLWHFCWDLTLFGLLDRAAMQSWTAQLVRAFIVCSFVLLAGISSRYSRSNGRRCLRLALCAAAVSLAPAAVGEPVRFGILHLLAVGTGVYALLRNALDRLPERAALALWGVLFAAGTFVPARVRVSVPWLWPLGLRTTGFFSADYYPIVPWLFLFLAGAAMGGLLRSSRAPWLDWKLPRALTWPGRHALGIYLIHQPVLWGSLYLLAGP